MSQNQIPIPNQACMKGGKKKEKVIRRRQIRRPWYRIIISALSYPLSFAYNLPIYHVSPLDCNSDNAHIILTSSSLKASRVAYIPKGIVYI